MPIRKVKVLFICTANLMRSRTAEDLYRSDPRFYVKSAGTSSLAERVVDDNLIKWADAIVVMEDFHRRQVLKSFSGSIDKKTVYCLRIPDVYPYMDPGLIEILRKRFERISRKITGDG